MTTQPWPPVPTKVPEWYKQAWFTVLTLVLCFPIGLVLMWMYQTKWHVALKSTISALFALFVIGHASNDSSKPTNPPTQTAPVVAVSPTPTQKRQAAKAAKEQATQAKIATKHQKEEDAKAAARAKRQEERDARKQAEAARQQEKQDRQQAEYNQTHYKNDGLTLDKQSIHWAEDDAGFASYVTGKVTNDSGGDLDYAEISFKELDGERSQVGTARDNITHLAAGATWKFGSGSNASD